jgi:hypothetical protein
VGIEANSSRPRPCSCASGPTMAIAACSLFSPESLPGPTRRSCFCRRQPLFRWKRPCGPSGNRHVRNTPIKTGTMRCRENRLSCLLLAKFVVIPRVPIFDGGIVPWGKCQARAEQVRFQNKRSPDVAFFSARQGQKVPRKQARSAPLTGRFRQVSILGSNYRAAPSAPRILQTLANMSCKIGA